jgi:hypothetical protein
VVALLIGHPLVAFGLALILLAAGTALLAAIATRVRRGLHRVRARRAARAGSAGSVRREPIR